MQNYNCDFRGIKDLKPGADLDSKSKVELSKIMSNRERVWNKTLKTSLVRYVLASTNNLFEKTEIMKYISNEVCYSVLKILVTEYFKV